MSVFELEVLRTGRRKSPQGRFHWEPKPFFTLSDEATEAVDPILERYGQSPLFYFNNILPEVQRFLPWAFVCLDREYPIAGHLVAARPAGAKTRLTTYAPLRGTVAADYVPPVGTLIVASKDELDPGAGGNRQESARVFWVRDVDAVRDAVSDRIRALEIERERE